jgi:transposase
MAKSQLRLKSIELRKNGESVREIAKKLNISRSTVSLWVRNVALTVEQVEFLQKRRLLSTEKGRTIGSLMQKQARLALIEKERTSGFKEFGILTTRELKIAGLCLYWAEGSKLQRRIELCNSDPQMIKFFVNWLLKVCKIPKEELKCYVGINEAHRDREEKIKSYWSEVSGIPLTNFTKTSFKKYTLHKVYENFDVHFGTLAVRVMKPARIFYKILGQIYGLSMAT